MSFYVTKASGEQELFNVKKFRGSLRKAGAPDYLIDEMVQDLENKPEMRSTKEIYHYALNYLHNRARPVATRYNLKQALLELGPAGFPFEAFVADLFKAQGYHIETDQIIYGACVEHEIDVLAQKDHQRFIVECKFHNRQGLKSDVKVTLYMKARFDDILKVWEPKDETKEIKHGAWIVTNTTFTSRAIQYGKCVHLNLLDWKYPFENSLPDLINRFGLHPITALTSLNHKQKKECIKHGFVLCRQADQHVNLLKRLHFNDYQIKNLLQEINDVCKISAKK